MLIALDWDGTYTAAPHIWNNFITDCRHHGIAVIVVTGRHDTEAHRIQPPFGIPVVYAGNEYKRKAAEMAGYKVNVWIDDMPEMIAPGGILQF